MNTKKTEERKSGASDVDGFYVFLYDEEDKNNQTQLKKGSRGGRFGFQNGRQEDRVLSLWCFDAGFGFK